MDEETISRPKEGDNSLEINVNESSKIIEIWLTNAEKQDQELHEKLKPLYQEFEAKKFLVAVFESGQRDLAEATSDLLCYNRRRSAEREVEQEKQMGMTISM